MASVNKVILLGNLGRDPQSRTTSSGSAVCSLALATTRKYKDAAGNSKEETEWHRISIFGRMAEIAQQYLFKGSQVYIEGRLHTSKFTDTKTGQEKYVTEIIAENMQFLGSKPRESAQTPAPAQSNATPRPASTYRQQPATAPQAAPQPHPVREPYQQQPPQPYQQPYQGQPYGAQPAQSQPAQNMSQLQEDDVPF